MKNELNSGATADSSTTDEVKTSSQTIANTFVGGSTLKHRRGKVVLSRQFIYDDPQEEILKPLFENFFPAATEPHHAAGMYNAIIFFGYSPHFREVKEGEVMPEYIAQLYRNDDGTTVFSGFTEC